MVTEDITPPIRQGIYRLPDYFFERDYVLSGARRDCLIQRLLIAGISVSGFIASLQDDSELAFYRPASIQPGR
jgi:hypothetical protein